MAPKTRMGTGDEDLVQCEECLRWCYLEETKFGRMADAKKAPFECRPCERARQGFERLERQWHARVEELEKNLAEEREAQVALEARVGELAKAGDAKAAQLVRTEAGLGEALERQAQLEKWVEELETRAAEADRQERCQRAERHDSRGEMALRAGDVAQESDGEHPSPRVDADNEDNTEVVQGAGGQPAISYVEATNRSGPVTKAPAEEPAAQEERTHHIFMVGNSNMRRAGEVIRGRVGNDDRVHVSTLPGQTVGAVMERAKAQLWDTMEDRNLVVIMGGVNDVLQGRGGGFAKQIARGVNELRVVSEDVQIAVCTIQEIQKQGIHIERTVVAANRELWTLGKTMNFAMVNPHCVRPVYVPASAQSMSHLCGRTGARTMRFPML